MAPTYSLRRTAMTALLTLLTACAPPDAPVPDDWYVANEALSVTAQALHEANEGQRVADLLSVTWNPLASCDPQPRVPDVVLYAIARTEPEAALVRACYGDTFAHATSYRPLAIGARLLGPDDDTGRLRTMAFLGTWPEVELPTEEVVDLHFETILGGGTWSFTGASRLAPSAAGVADFPDYLYSPRPRPHHSANGATLKVGDSGWYMTCGELPPRRTSAVLRCDSGRCDYEARGAPALLPVSFESAPWAECVAATDADRPAPVNTLATALEKRWTPPAAPLLEP